MGVTLGEIREVHREFPIVSRLAANIFHFCLSKTDECNEEVLLPDNDPHHLGAILAQGNVVRVFDLGRKC